VTLTLTLDQVILHTVVYHSLTSTYMPNFVLWTNGRMYIRTRETGFVRSTLCEELT